MKITVNREGGYKLLCNHTPLMGKWFVREDFLAVCHILTSYYVVVFFPSNEAQLVTVATTEGKWTPCEVELVVT